MTGLTNGTEYNFAVRAVNASGQGMEATASATRNPVPAAPANLTATASVGQVALSWDDPDDDSIQRWEYRRKEDNGAYGNWGTIDDSDKDTTSHDVTGLTNGVAYTFAVRAVNATGDGVASTQTVTRVPAAPAGLAAAPGDAQVTPSWTNPGNGSITGGVSPKPRGLPSSSYQPAARRQTHARSALADSSTGPHLQTHGILVILMVLITFSYIRFP